MHHSPQRISSNHYIELCFNLVIGLFPDAGLNSVLINYYPIGASKLNFHSDDESEICKDSYIFTLSLGHSRNMLFRSVKTKRHLARVTLNDRSLLLFSRASQYSFQHAIPPGTGDQARISLTFRKLVIKN